MRALIGVDVGGTTTSGALVTPEGEVSSVIRVPTRKDGPGTAVGTLLGVIGDLLAQARVRGVELEGIGMGIPGPVDVEKGMMRPFPNLVPEFGDVPLAARVEILAGVPAFVDNDVNALALAEWMFGLGRGASSLVVLAIGSGLGGGIVIDGHLVRGHGGFGGELGHIPVKFDGLRCVCGVRGCVAAYISGWMIADRARELAVPHRASTLLALAGGDPAQITPALVFEAAAAGDPVAGPMVDEACEALAASLGGIVNGLDPEVIVVTGGVVGSLLPLQGDILARASRYILAAGRRQTRIHFTAADKQSTMRGGAALALYELDRRDRRRTLGED